MQGFFRTKNVPPKFAIANQWTLGKIPDNISEGMISEVMAAMIAPIRPFAYLINFSGGSDKKLRGHYSFFKNNISHLGGVLNHYNTTGKVNPHIFCVLTGRFTPEQRNMAKMKSMVDTRQFSKLIQFYKQVNNYVFKDIPVPENCPQPVLISAKETKNNTDETNNPSVENDYEGSKFYFPDTTEPTENCNIFQSEQEFIEAMLKGTSPTLVCKGSEYMNIRNHPLPEMFPIQFPFGLGDVHEKRRNLVSVEAGLKHLLRLSLPQVHRPEFALVINNMLNTIESFRSGYIKCISNGYGPNFAQSVSQLTSADVRDAAKRYNDNASSPFHQRKPILQTPATKFLHSVSSSCQPIGHSEAAAKLARTKHLGLSEFSGCYHIFVTATMCDENSFRVGLYATSRPRKLPKLNLSEDECIADLHLRQKYRTCYPGACSLEFESMMQIVIKCLLGWDTKTKTSKNGIFGKLLHLTRTIEEQGRGTLHDHLCLWVENFQTLRKLLFHENKDIKTKAREEMLKYAEKIMSSSYGDLEISHSCNGKTIIGKPDDLLSIKSCQHLRDLRNKNHCHDLNGIIAECSICNKQFSSPDLINNAMQYLFNTNKKTIMYGHGVQQKEPFPISREKLDIYAYRTVYDIRWNNNKDIKQNDNIRTCMLHYRFDEHDWRHRPSCFKKGCECRANFPTFTNNNPIEMSFGEKEAEIYSIFYQVRFETKFSILTERRITDLYMNTHNSVISEVCNCNNNVSFGDMAQMFYCTLYSTKSNQKEETASFLAASNALDKRINKTLHENNNSKEEETKDPDFSEGLKRVLGAIRAHVSSSVISPPMAHYLARNKTRFVFSRDFTYMYYAHR